ncbi:MAG: rRNA maturation RNase YbeY [Chloroflexi bacterium]|nr:rRNA maturation RNase YbeY [Chloroflexota bacterium]
MASGADFSIIIEVDPSLEGKPETTDLEKVAAATLEAYGREGPVELTVVVTTDETIRDYNRRYLGRDRPTDVLAFGTEVSGTADVFVHGPAPVRYLGDIMVSYDRAVEQAPEYAHSVTEELHQLIIHGVLHLLGHDDATGAQQEEMRRMEGEVLRRLGEK